MRTPFGKILPPFRKMRTPFGKMRTPFGKMRTPFGKMRTPFGKMRTPFTSTLLPQLTRHYPQYFAVCIFDHVTYRKVGSSACSYRGSAKISPVATDNHLQTITLRIKVARVARLFAYNYARARDTSNSAKAIVSTLPIPSSARMVNLPVACR
jgi:hypothetical protein